MTNFIYPPEIIFYFCREEQSIMKFIDHDFVVVGSGLAGLAAAYYASHYGNVAILTKAELDVSNSYFAQGGIAAALNSDDTPDLHFEDTLTAGRGLCDHDSVRILVEEGIDRVKELIDMGMKFDMQDNEISAGMEGGHSRRRIWHSGGDSTGRDLTKFMLNKVKEKKNITAYEHTKAVEILVKDGRSYGLKAVHFGDMSTLCFRSNAVIVGTGGLSRMYERSTNPHTATGDGIAIAWYAGARLADMEFIQFHPSALCIPGGQAFLLSEALRGEGAYLLDKNLNRFMPDIHPLAELAPRDTVTKAIYYQTKKDQSKSVYLSAKHLDGEYIKSRFSNIYKEVAKQGLDLIKDPIPIAPAAHYMVGGIQTGLHGETNIEGLWACGEVASTGVMGANRLASNSLLECLVFAKRAAEHACNYAKMPKHSVFCEKMKYDQENDDVFLQYKNEISDIMANQVGIVRNAEGLQNALIRLKEIHEKYKSKKDWYNLSKINNHADICFLISRSALLREESRGGHLREDFPSLNPDLEYHIIQQKNCEPQFEPVRK